MQSNMIFFLVSLKYLLSMICHWSNDTMYSQRYAVRHDKTVSLATETMYDVQKKYMYMYYILQ